MFAINHAATALLVKRRFRKVPLLCLLVSAQLVEVLWVLLNAAALASPSVRAWLEEVPLADVPYAHSVALSAAVAFAAWLVLAKFLRRHAVGAAVSVAVMSHVALDLFDQAQGAALAPFAQSAALFGPALDGLAWQDFAVQAAYGVLCWRVFRGTMRLLVVILAFNLAGLFFAPHLDGPEGLWAHASPWLTGAVALELGLTVALVWHLSRLRAAELEGWLGR
ncbi:MAG: hypothetical protein EPO20_27415 [Betaproteobacteria bacterium]|nr:MAG: hypothetical protein EPO20_27415 [Betaproteobacteria bacterium]